MHARTPAVFVFASVVLGGCVTTQPQMPHDGADRGTRYVALAEPHGGLVSASIGDADSNGAGPLPVIENRPPFPIDPAAFAVPDDERELESTKPLDESASRDRDIWDRIRDGLSLSDPIHPKALREAVWYGRHREYLHRTASRARPYLAYIVHEVEKRKLPIEFSLLPIVESAFQPFAYSPKDAAGLWQFIPATGRRYGLKQNWWYDGRRDVVESTRAALEYLTKLLQDFDGDPLLAVAAYNWGEGQRGACDIPQPRAGEADRRVVPAASPRDAIPRIASARDCRRRCESGPVLMSSWSRFPTACTSRRSFSTARSTLQWLRISPASRSTSCTCSIRDSSAGPPIRAGPHRLQLPRHHVDRFPVLDSRGCPAWATCSGPVTRSYTETRSRRSPNDTGPALRR